MLLLLASRGAALLDLGDVYEVLLVGWSREEGQGSGGGRRGILSGFA